MANTTRTLIHKLHFISGKDEPRSFTIHSTDHVKPILYITYAHRFPAYTHASFIQACWPKMKSRLVECETNTTCVWTKVIDHKSLAMEFQC